MGGILPHDRTSVVASGSSHVEQTLLSVLLPSADRSVYATQCATKKALVEVAGHSEWQEHVTLIDSSIMLLGQLVHGSGGTADDLFAIRCLGSRLYNDCATTFILILSGYYQTSTMAMRDALECCLLLKLFTVDRTEIKRWREATRKESMRDFKFGHIRKLLENKNDSDKNFLERLDTAHKLLCEYGVHPTFKSIRTMQFKKPQLYYGSFFNEKMCGHFLAELARISSLMIYEFVRALGNNNITPDLQKQYILWSKQAYEWISKYKTFPTKKQAGKALE